MAPVEEEITRDALVQAVLEALHRDVGGEGLRASEIAKAMGISMLRVRVALMRIKEVGQLEICRRCIERLDGYVTTVTAYRLKDEGGTSDAR